MNTALSTIMLDINEKTFGQQASAKRFKKLIFELRPVFPKYSRIWHTNQVLNYLKLMRSSVSFFEDIDYYIAMFTSRTKMPSSSCTGNRSHELV